MTFSASTHLLMCLSLETLISIIRTNSPILVELVGGLDLWHLFLLTLVFVLQWLSLHWDILIMMLSQFPLTLHCVDNGMPFLDILVLIGTVAVIIWEMFHGRISLNSALLLLLVKFFEWVQVGIDLYIPHWKYQVNSHSSPLVFSCLCCCHRS